MIARRKRKRKWISGLFILVLIIVAGIVCYLVWENYFKEEKNSKNDEPESVKVEEKIEEESIDGKEEQEIVEKEEVVQYEGEDPNDLEEITGVITYAEASENYLMIRINIDQYLSGGICNLRVYEFGSEIYTDSVALINSASTTTCEGFDVPISAIGGGDFQLFIDVDADGKNGTIMGEASI